MKHYFPNPLDTKDVNMPDELNLLTEKLAENNHEEWALNRIKDGWVYGAERCDKKKYHPCIIPYNKLSEGEKEYDRISAKATIKLLLALGYKIIKRIVSYYLS